MDKFFGNPWRTLTIEQVEGFFADAGDEGLTWEAKGTERPHPESVLKNVSAFGNTDGGFYILGATRSGKKSGPWHLDAIDFGGEPTTWLSRVIRNGLQPVPKFDVKEFELDGRHVAIVNVDPVAEPPCMTRNGQVFTRVSGESPAVTDPTTLRRLHESGDARRLAAEGEARRATETLLEGSDVEPPYLRIALALAPVGRAVDISALLFSERFYQEINSASDFLPGDPLFPYNDRTALVLRPQQDAFRMYDNGESNRQRWSLIASWDGSVGVALDVRPESEDSARLQATAIFGDAVRPAEELAARLVATLGGYGRSHVMLRIFSRGFTIGSVQGHYGKLPGPNTFLPIQTWTGDDGRVTTDQFDRMRRELVRACSVLVYEPAPEPEPSTTDA